MASKENQEALDLLEHSIKCAYLNKDLTFHNVAYKQIETLQKAIDNEELYKKAFEMAVKVYDKDCREDYWLNLARKVLERVRRN